MSTQTQKLLSDLSDGFETLTENATRSIFHIGGKHLSYRSGLLVDEQHILTPAVEAETGEQVEVRAPDGSTRNAEVAGYDPHNELAVLRLLPASDSSGDAGKTKPGSEQGYRPIAVSPGPAPKIGRIVLTVAHPSPDGHEVRLDMIRCVGGSWDKNPDADGYFQTDGSAYPGFGGAAVIGTDGNLLGVVTSNRHGNEGYILPADKAIAIARRLIDEGSPVRGYLGIRTQKVKDEAEGLLVVEVEAESAARKGGVRVGDILTTWNGTPMESPAQLLKSLATWDGKTPVEVGLRRGEEKMTLSLTPQAVRATRSARWGGWKHRSQHP